MNQRVRQPKTANMDNKPHMKDIIHRVIHNLRKYEKIQEKLQKVLDIWRIDGYNILALENRALFTRAFDKRHIDL